MAELKRQAEEDALKHQDAIVNSATSPDDCVVQMQKTCDKFVLDFVSKNTFLKEVHVDEIGGLKTGLEPYFRDAWVCFIQNFTIFSTLFSISIFDCIIYLLVPLTTFAIHTFDYTCNTYL